MAESTEKTIRRLISAGTVATFQIRTGSATTSVQGRLVKEGMRDGDRGIWVRLEGTNPALVEKLIKSGTPVLVRADDGPRRVSFVTSFLDRRWRLIAGEQVLIGWPGTIESQERRRSAREPVAAGEVSAILKIGGKVVAAALADLSAEGAGLLCPPTVAAELKPAQTVELRLKFGGTEVGVAARVCRVAGERGAVRVGLAFEDEGAEQVGKWVEQMKGRRVAMGLKQMMKAG